LLQEQALCPAIERTGRPELLRVRHELIQLKLRGIGLVNRRWSSMARAPDELLVERHSFSTERTIYRIV